MSRISPSEEIKRAREQLAQLTFELKTITSERDQVKSSLESLAAELNRMSRMAESLLSERTALLTERNNLLDEVARLNKDRENLQSRLQAVEGEEGLAVDPGTLAAAIQSSVQKATSHIASASKTPFKVASLDVSFRGVITRDGKVVLPSSSRIVPDRLGTIALSIHPQNSQISSSNAASSGSSDTIELPDLRNTTTDLAIQLIQSLGATSETIEHETLERPDGTVIDQDPRPGTQIMKKSTKVRLIASKMPPSTPSPDLVGKRFDEASTILEKEGIRHHFMAIGVEKYEEHLGRVVTQRPPQGSPLLKQRDLVELDVKLLFRPIERLGTVDRSIAVLLRSKGISTLADLVLNPAVRIEQISETQLSLLKQMARMLVLLPDMDSNAAKLLIQSGGIANEKDLAQADPVALRELCEKNISKADDITPDYMSKFTMEKITSLIESAKKLR